MMLVRTWTWIGCDAPAGCTRSARAMDHTPRLQWRHCHHHGVVRCGHTAPRRHDAATMTSRKLSLVRCNALTRPRQRVIGQ